MAIKRINLPDGTEVAIDEWLHWPIYSTGAFSQLVNPRIRLFNYVQGGRPPTQGLAGRTATIADTNQVARSRMNHDEAFLAYSITYEPFALSTGVMTGSPLDLVVAPLPVVDPRNLRRLQRDIVVDFIIGADQNKPQFRAPLAYIGQGIGAVAFTTGDTLTVGTAFSYGTAGEISPKRNQRQWKLPIYVQSDRVMKLLFKSQNGIIADLTQDIQIRFWLDGLKRRPVA